MSDELIFLRRRCKEKFRRKRTLASVGSRRIDDDDKMEKTKTATSTDRMKVDDDITSVEKQSTELSLDSVNRRNKSNSNNHDNSFGGGGKEQRAQQGHNDVIDKMRGSGNIVKKSISSKVGAATATTPATATATATATASKTWLTTSLIGKGENYKKGSLSTMRGDKMSPESSISFSQSYLPDDDDSDDEDFVELERQRQLRELDKKNYRSKTTTSKNDSTNSNLTKRLLPSSHEKTNPSRNYLKHESSSGIARNQWIPEISSKIDKKGTKLSAKSDKNNDGKDDQETTTKLENPTMNETYHQKNSMKKADSGSSSEEDEDLVELSMSFQNLPATTTTNSYPTLKPLSTYGNDDDSSDDDLVMIAREVEKQKKKQEEKRKEECMKSDSVHGVEKKKRQNRNDLEKKVSEKLKTVDVEDTSASGEARGLDRKSIDIIKEKHSYAQPQPSSPSNDSKDTVEEEGLSVDRGYVSNGSSKSSNTMSGKTAVRNPITLMKKQESYVSSLESPFEQQKHKSVETTRKNKTFSDATSLWSDSSDDNASNSKEAKEKPQKRKKMATKTKKKDSQNKKLQDSRKGNTAATTKNKMEQTKCTLSNRKDIRNSIVHDDEDVEEIQSGGTIANEEKMREKLHPNFANPRFLFPSEPLILSATITMDHDNDTNHHEEDKNEHEVPSSMNRYLPEYQREGIQFLYNAISAGMGAILGDEMGLGKTVQIVALMAAMLKKTGTGFDLYQLKQRTKLILAHQRKVLADKEKALLLGKDEETDVRDTLEMIADKIPGNTKISTRWIPILLVVPPTVMQNWLNELKAWGHFGVAFYRGNERDKALEDIKNGLAEILICGKSLFQQKYDFQSLKSIHWKLIIIDEFHLFKNPDGILSKNLREMKCTYASIVLGMTGTLMQNDHKELWNLVDLVETDYLGSWREFEYEISKPIKLGRTKTASPDAVRLSERKHEELLDQLRPLFIERKKMDVLQDQLPQKDERVIFCELSSVQKRIYEHILNLPDYELLRKAQGPCDCGVNQEFFEEYGKLRTPEERVEYQRKHKGEVVTRRECCYAVPSIRDGYSNTINPDAVLWRSHDKHDNGEQCDRCPFCILFPAMSKLYRLSSHAALLQLEKNPTLLDKNSKARRGAAWELEFAKVALPVDILPLLPGKSYFRGCSIMDDHFKLSGKMKVLDGLLKKMEMEHECKVLIFSASTQTLDLIENYIRSVGYSFLRMDGSTPQKKRQDLADQFQKDANLFVFLLSTKAMGLGLNLTEANKVIIFDVEWNPSWDAQAQDRAYRIGQQKNVQVIRLVARGTIDELKYIRQVYKIQLKKETIGDLNESRSARMFRGVAGDKNRKGELFGVENLLKYKDGSFMQDLWKSAGGGGSSSSSGGASLTNGHSALDVLKAVNGMTDDDVDNAFVGEFNEFDQVAKRMIEESQVETLPGSGEKSVSNYKKSISTDNISTRRQGESSKDTSFVNHMDFFHEDRGGAALQEGDDGFNLELGGESQIFCDIIYEQAEVNSLPPGSSGTPSIPEENNREEVEKNKIPEDTRKKRNVRQKREGRRSDRSHPTANLALDDSMMDTIIEETSDVPSEDIEELDSYCDDNKPGPAKKNNDHNKDKRNVQKNCGGTIAPIFSTGGNFATSSDLSPKKKGVKTRATGKGKKRPASSYSKNNNGITLFGLTSAKLAQKKGRTTFSASDIFTPSSKR